MNGRRHDGDAEIRKQTKVENGMSSVVPARKEKLGINNRCNIGKGSYWGRGWSKCAAMALWQILRTTEEKTQPIAIETIRLNLLRDGLVISPKSPRSSTISTIFYSCRKEKHLIHIHQKWRFVLVPNCFARIRQMISIVRWGLNARGAKKRNCQESRINTNSVIHECSRFLDF